LSKDGVSSASPKVRKFARELGADIVQIPGSQRAGRVTEDDVKKFVRSQVSVNEGKVEKKVYKDEYPHEAFGEVEKKDLPRVKKLSGPQLVRSWTEIPHVTQHDEIDITEMEQFRTTLIDNYSGDRIRISPLAFITRAVVNALKEYPNFNSSIDPENLQKEIEGSTANAYDLVLNGLELGGGSLRIHEANLQREVLKTVGLTAKEINEKFGFLIEALEMGAPPHGGIAFGLDRITMLIIGADSIRETIAFPKNQQAKCLLTNAPSNVSESQLKDLDIEITIDE